MPPDAPDAGYAPHHFSTADLPEHERLNRWREEFGRGLVKVDIEPLASDVPFGAKATLQALPGVRLGFVAGSPAHYRRTPAMAAEGDDAIGLVINLGPKAVVSQRGADVVLARGCAVPIINDQAAVLTSRQHLGLLFSRAALASRGVDGRPTRMICATSEPLRLLVGYLRLVHQEVAPTAPALRQIVANHIHDLAALALCPNPETRHHVLSAVAAARLAAALAHIAENYADPSFSLALVARRQGVSPRYLQRLFEASGTSFTARISELRLQKAFALLMVEQPGRRRISDIALDAGFSDISNFNRLFRARFGDTPSGIRGRR